ENLRIVENSAQGMAQNSGRAERVLPATPKKSQTSRSEPSGSPTGKSSKPLMVLKNPDYQQQKEWLKQCGGSITVDTSTGYVRCPDGRTVGRQPWVRIR